MSKKPSQIKGRIWTFIIYPESAPSDWLDKLRTTGVPAFVSPLHDKDVEDDGVTPKKKHRHGCMVFDGPTSLSAVQALTKSLNAPNPQKVMSVMGMYNYFTHQNAPEKHQYDPADMIILNGFNIAKYEEEKSVGERHLLRRQIVDIVFAQNFYEFADLINYLASMGNEDLMNAALDNDRSIGRIIDSRRNSVRDADAAVQRGEALRQTIRRELEQLLKEKQNVCEEA